MAAKTKLTKEVLGAILKTIAVDGEDVEVAARKHGVTGRAIRKRAERDARFRRRYEEAKADSMAFRVARLERTLEGAALGLASTRDVKVVAGIFLLKNWAPDRFRDVHDLNLGSRPGESLVFRAYLPGGESLPSRAPAVSEGTLPRPETS